MIDKLGFVGRPLDLTIEKVQEESAPVAQNIPLKEEVSHAPQEAQFAESQKSELAMFGTLQQMTLGAQLERKTVVGDDIIKPTPMQELRAKLKNLEGELEAVGSQMRQIEEEFATLGPDNKDRALQLALQYNELSGRKKELEIEIQMVSMEIQKLEAEQQLAEQQLKDEQMVMKPKIPLW